MRQTIDLHINLKPVPASRPRVTRRGFSFYAKPYSTFKKQLEKALKETMDEVQWEVTDCLFECHIMCILPPFKTSTRKDPMGDVDNFAKAVTDAMTASECFWHDDRQMMKLIASKRFAEPDEQPHIEIHLRRLTDG